MCRAFTLLSCKTALLNVETQPKQLLGYLPLDITLPLIALEAKIGLGQKGQSVTKPLAYYAG